MRFKDKIEASSNREKAYSYLTEVHGFEPHIAAGMIGNFMVESSPNLKVNAYNPNDVGKPAFGLAQWRGGRLDKLKEYAGGNINSLETQLDYMVWELNNTEKRALEKLKTATTAKDAALLFSKYYERPSSNPKLNHNDKRANYAETLYSSLTPIKKEGSEEEVMVYQKEFDKVSSLITEEYNFKVKDEREEVSAVKDKLDTANKEVAFKKELTDIFSGVNPIQEPEPQPQRYTPELNPQELLPQENEFLSFFLNPKMQEGGEVNYDYVDYGTKEYAQAYKEGRFANFANPLDEVVITVDKKTGRNLSLQESIDDIQLKDNPLQNIIKSKGVTLNERGLNTIKSESTSTRNKENIKNTSNNSNSNTIQNQPEVLEAIKGKDYNKLINSNDDFSISNLQLKDIENLNEQQAKEVQKELVTRGYLKYRDSIETPKTKDQTKELQTMLLSKGYDLGKYGVNKDGVDGIFGSKTKAALQDYNLKIMGVDGIVGDKTKGAFKQYKAEELLNNVDEQEVEDRFFDMKDSKDITIYQDNLQNQGYFKGIDVTKPSDKDIVSRGVNNIFSINNEEVCEDERCTWYIGKEIEKKVKEEGRKNIDAYGDAWEISERLVNKGAQEIFSIFEEEKPQLKSSEIESYIKSRVENTPKVDTSQIKSGDVVNLFYEGSSYKDQAYTEGSKYFTSHAGIVKSDSEGNLYVEHNVGGKIYKENLEDLAQGKVKNKANKNLNIAAVIRPNYKLPETAEFYDSTDLQVNEFEVGDFRKLGSKNAALFTQTLIKNKEELQQDIPINDEEFENLAKASKVIGWKESGYNYEGSVDSPKLFTVQGLKKAARNLGETFGGREMSRGITQMKDQENLNQRLRDRYIKGNGSNLNDPTEAAVPTFYALSSRYLYLKDLSKKNNLTITSDELSQLAMLGWNQPIDKVAKSLEKYKNYESVMEAYRKDNPLSYELAFTAFDKYIK